MADRFVVIFVGSICVCAECKKLVHTWWNGKTDEFRAECHTHGCPQHQRQGSIPGLAMTLQPPTEENAHG